MSTVAMPAEAEIVPLQRLLRLQNPEEPRQALQFVRALQAAGSPYFAEGRRALRRLEALTVATANYISHEYLNEHWHPCLFAETAASLSTAGLRFAASANLLDQFDALKFTPEQCALLATIDDAALRETTRDFLRTRRQRYDVFVKGNAAGPGIPDDQLFVLTTPPAMAADGRAIAEQLAADDFRPKPLPPQASREAVFALIDAGHVLPAQPRALAEQAAPFCARLNAEILRRSLDDDTIAALASPVTGTGIDLSRAQLLFLKALHDGAETPEQWTTFARGILQTETVDLLKEALYFQLRLPALRALGLLDQAP